ncbi:uncharacterized protein [Lepeophtheirus salmonis]|uniref:uncharacterized protein n=1 Tax=Lepeophtheirus salmonis TaxID=72036 RepID=UPI001AE73756|nr:uncharacterized protein LOC121117747 [Lepeophtheirus salmonis]XP_040568167.1 uncharacterized protein LOC121117747 [Lepeophtheirus salmonis]
MSINNKLRLNITLEGSRTPNYVSPCNSAPGTPLRGLSPSRSATPNPYDAPPISPSVRRARELNRDIRRGRNFRENSLSRRTPLRSDSVPRPPGTELSFTIKPSIGGRKGWKIMPEETESEPITDPVILKRVVDMIKEMEMNGSVIPERLSIRV